MKNIRYFAQKYVEWVIRLGRVRFSILGFVVLSIWALFTQIILSLLIIGEINWLDLALSIVFGLISAPFVIYFFTVLVEKLEYSRQGLADTVANLRNEVSERLLAEHKLSEALESIEKTSRDKTRFMTTISHELRTPLNGIIGLSRILLDEQLTDKQRDYLKTINMSAVSLGHIFSDIIDLEKIDAHRIELNLKPTELTGFINDISSFATLMAAEKQLKFELEVTNSLPNWLMLDYARLSQILWNLISNAVKFTATGKVSLSIERDTSGYIIFKVSDTGIGIPEEEIPRIFDMYYQVQSNENKPLGSGIGLSVAKTIAQLMEGDLSVESKLNRGTTFTLRFPIQEVESPIPTLQILPNQLHILLVEDIEVNIVVAKSVLEKLGYKVDVAMTGQEAIQKFEQSFYDLVLLDIQLPDISGFEVAQHLRDGYQKGIYDALPPLIALTANVMSDKQEYRRKGMDDVLRKPLALEELNKILLEYFDENIAIDIAKMKDINLHLNTENPQIDENILQELVEILGQDMVWQNLNLFKKMMPNYIVELKLAYQKYMQQREKSRLAKDVGDVAHKIKGAAASVGLKRLQLIATMAQDPNSPEWADQIESWIEQLGKYWLEDTEIAEHRIKKLDKS